MEGKMGENKIITLQADVNKLYRSVIEIYDHIVKQNIHIFNVKIDKYNSTYNDKLLLYLDILSDLKKTFNIEVKVT